MNIVHVKFGLSLESWLTRFSLSRQRGCDERDYAIDTQPRRVFLHRETKHLRLQYAPPADQNILQRHVLLWRRFCPSEREVHRRESWHVRTRSRLASSSERRRCSSLYWVAARHHMRWWESPGEGGVPLFAKNRLLFSAVKRYLKSRSLAH